MLGCLGSLIMSKVKCLSHYTSLNNVLAILKNGSFKFSRLRFMNDLQEAGLEYYYPKLSNFYSCSFIRFKRESIPMWKMYSKKSERDIGVMIKLVFSHSASFNELFKNKNVICKDVSYIKQSQYNKYARGDEISGETIIEGFSKSSCWDFEKAFRYGIYSTTDEVYCELNFDVLDKIEIIVYPTEINVDVRIMKRQRLKTLNIDESLYKKISFHKSSLVGILKNN